MDMRYFCLPVAIHSARKKGEAAANLRQLRLFIAVLSIAPIYTGACTYTRSGAFFLTSSFPEVTTIVTPRIISKTATIS